MSCTSAHITVQYIWRPVHYEFLVWILISILLRYYQYACEQIQLSHYLLHYLFMLGCMIIYRLQSMLKFAYKAFWSHISGQLRLSLYAIQFGIPNMHTCTLQSIVWVFHYIHGCIHALVWRWHLIAFLKSCKFNIVYRTWPKWSVHSAHSSYVIGEQGRGGWGSDWGELLQNKVLNDANRTCMRLLFGNHATFVCIIHYPPPPPPSPPHSIPQQLSTWTYIIIHCWLLHN